MLSGCGSRQWYCAACVPVRCGGMATAVARGPHVWVTTECLWHVRVVAYRGAFTCMSEQKVDNIGVLPEARLQSTVVTASCEASHSRYGEVVLRLLVHWLIPSLTPRLPWQSSIGFLAVPSPA